MNANRKIAMLTLAAITGVNIVMPGTTYAQTPTPAYPLSTLVERIAQKFSLKQTDVQAVVDQFHLERHTEKLQMHQNRQQSRLDQLVKDGNITAAQKQAILSQYDALQKKYVPTTGAAMTPEERAKKMLAMHDELVAWAKSQGIEPIYVIPGFGMGMGGMHGFKGGRMMKGY